MGKLNPKSRNGFTLIELLVVIGILAVLMAIGIPSVAGLIDRANVSADDTNGNEMTNAIERFVSEYELYRQDMASGRINVDDLDAAQSRVYNAVGPETMEDIKKLESSATLNGYRLDPSTKYPQNWDTATSIIRHYIKTSSSTFEPKQSDMHFWYSPDCGLVFTGEPDISTGGLNAKVISGKDAKGNTLSESTRWIDLTIEGEKEKGDEVITEYTLEDIENNPLLYGIGKTKQEYVVAEFNETYTSVKITKNGKDSDGYMVNWVNNTTPFELPMFTHRNTLTDATICEGVMNVGDYAFINGKTEVLNVSLPNSLLEIGNSSFRQSKILKIEIPSNVKRIGQYAFAQCPNVTGDIVIPNSVEIIDDYGFYGITSTTGAIRIGNGTKFVGEFAFGSGSETIIPKYSALYLGNSIEFIGHGAFQLCHYVSNEIILPETLKVIGDFAFNHMSRVANTTLRIPASVIKIGGTTNTSDITPNNFLSASYLDIGTHTFYNFATKNITKYEVDSKNQYFKAVDGVLFSKDGTRLLSYPSSKSGSEYIIPEGVTKIDELAFNNIYISGQSNYLKVLTLPNSYIVKSNSELSPNILNSGNSLTVAIYSHSGIEKIKIKTDNPNYTTYDGCLYSKDGKTCLYIPSYKRNISIKEGCTTINGAFITPTKSIRSGESKNFTIYIPASVTSISSNTSVSGVLECFNSLVEEKTYWNTVITVDSANTVYTTDTNGYIIKK